MGLSERAPKKVPTQQPPSPNVREGWAVKSPGSQRPCLSPCLPSKKSLPKQLLLRSSIPHPLSPERQPGAKGTDELPGGVRLPPGGSCQPGKHRHSNPSGKQCCQENLPYQAACRGAQKMASHLQRPSRGLDDPSCERDFPEGRRQGHLCSGLLRPAGREAVPTLGWALLSPGQLSSLACEPASCDPVNTGSEERRDV